MAQTLAFGTYIPAASPIHKLNAQVKIILACVFSIAIFFIESWAGMLAILATVIVLYAISRVPVRNAVRGLLPIAFILVFTVVVHAFSINLGGEPAPGSSSAGSLGLTQQWAIVGSFGITLDGLARGVFFALRIALLVAICSLLTFTTSMVELTDAMLRIFSPLRKIGVPIDDLAMMVSIALRFIPITAQEAHTIQLAQKARCANFESGNVFARMRAWVPVFIPLFVRLFKRADELAIAMDARCYEGATRNHLRAAKMNGADIAMLVVGIALICVLGWFL